MNSSTRDSATLATQAVGSYIRLALITIGSVVALVVLFNIIAWNNAGELKFVQYPNGHISAVTATGPFLKFFGDVKTYRQVVTVTFGKDISGGGNAHKSAEIPAIPVMFDDASSATISGIVRVNLPTDVPQLLEIRRQYAGGYEHFVANGIIPVVANAVKLSANLRSSQDAYMGLAPFQRDIEDQLTNGTFETRSVEKWVKRVTGDSERVKATEIILDDKGQPVRRSTTLEKLGCTVPQCNIGIPDFDAQVLDMIKKRKDQALQVEVAKQSAIRAQQDAITAKANGEAEAAKAKWTQEAIKATAVTIAEKNRDSAQLVMQAAQYIKQATILEGEGEAQKRRLIIQADGALSVKCQTWLDAQKVWAEAFSKYQGSIVPQIQTGGSGQGNGALNFMELMGMKAARDLSLDMNIPKK